MQALLLLRAQARFAGARGRCLRLGEVGEPAQGGKVVLRGGIPWREAADAWRGGHGVGGRGEAVEGRGRCSRGRRDGGAGLGGVAEQGGGVAQRGGVVGAA